MSNTNGMNTGSEFHPFRNEGLVDLSAATHAYSVDTVVVDRLAGLTITEPIWSGITTNSAHVSRLLADESVRRDVTEFFSGRRLRLVYMEVVKTPSTRIGGYKFSVGELLAAVSNHCDSRSASAIMEIIMPAFVANDLVVAPGESVPIMNRYTVPFTIAPTVRQLSLEVSRIEIERVVRECTASWKLEAGRQYATSVMADEVAQAFFPMGRALRTVFEYDIVFSDIVKAVRVTIDPMLDGLTGDVPSIVRDHPVVAALSTNWTFVREALALVGSVTPDLTEFKFDKMAQAALAMIKTSDRFALRVKRDLLSEHGLMHVNDLRGNRRAAILYEDAKMDPVALSVIALNDDVLAGAVTIDRSIGRIDSHIAAAYHEVPRVVSPRYVAGALRDVLTHMVELEQSASYGAYVMQVRGQPLEQTAMLLSDQIIYDPKDPSTIVYRLSTSAKFSDDLGSGIVQLGQVYTTDPAEVLLVADGFEPTRAAEPLPQLLPKAALGSHLFCDDLDELTQTSHRYSFNNTVGRAVLQGSLRWVELESARADVDATLIKPVYNASVFKVVSDAMDLIRTQIDRSPIDITRQLTRMYARTVIDMARSVAPAFRGGVHRLMVQRSLAKVAQADVRLASAQLNTAASSGFTDLFAAAFFFAIQGIGRGAAETQSFERRDVVIPSGESAKVRRLQLDEVFTSVWREPLMAEVMAEQGTDRKLQ